MMGGLFVGTFFLLEGVFGNAHLGGSDCGSPDYTLTNARRQVGELSAAMCDGALEGPKIYVWFAALYRFAKLEIIINEANAMDSSGSDVILTGDESLLLNDTYKIMFRLPTIFLRGMVCDYSPCEHSPNFEPYN